MSRFSEEIDRVSRERSQSLRLGKPIEQLTTELDTLYDQRRRARAEQQHGPKERILKSARIQLELEKLTKS